MKSQNFGEATQLEITPQNALQNWFSCLHRHAALTDDLRGSHQDLGLPLPLRLQKIQATFARMDSPSAHGFAALASECSCVVGGPGHVLCPSCKGAGDSERSWVSTNLINVHDEVKNMLMSSYSKGVSAF